VIAALNNLAIVVSLLASGPNIAIESKGDG
jgi:hypothetical protein